MSALRTRRVRRVQLWDGTYSTQRLIRTDYGDRQFWIWDTLHVHPLTTGHAA